MAKPDCDDGWYKKSIELEAALDFADFTKIARIILRYGFCQIFGQGRRPRYMTLHTAEIAERIGKHRQNVHRAMDELIKSHVLAPVAGKPGAYRFVKDYEKWTFIARVKSAYVESDVPRLNRTEVADCKNSVSYSRGFELRTDADRSGINFGDTSEVPGESLSPRLVTFRHPDWLQNVTSIGDEMSPRLVTESSPPKNPLLGRETRREEKTPSQLPSQEEDIEMVKFPDQEDPEPHPEFAGLSAWVRRKLADEGYDDDALDEADKLCRGWLSTDGDPEWCAQAFQASIENVNTMEKTQYARGILRRMYRELKAGEPVLAPAFCDYRPARAEKPAVPELHRLEATGTAPGQYIPRPSKSQRDADLYKAQVAGIMKMFPVPTKEDHLDEG